MEIARLDSGVFLINTRWLRCVSVHEGNAELECCWICEVKKDFERRFGWMKGEWIERDEAALIILRGHDGRRRES